MFFENFRPEFQFYQFMLKFLFKGWKMFCRRSFFKNHNLKTHAQYLRNLTVQDLNSKCQNLPTPHKMETPFLYPKRINPLRLFRPTVIGPTIIRPTIINPPPIAFRLARSKLLNSTVLDDSACSDLALTKSKDLSKTI